MEINSEVVEILKEFKINKSEGLLCLLAIYFKLDPETTIPEETIKAINITKIVDKDYGARDIKWNIPLFAGQETAFDWVKEWIEPFGRLNPDRKGSWRDALTRMKDFFKKYPEFRKEDVINARNLYLSGIKDPKYLMQSHKFIFDGMGAMKKSTLLAYCEKVKGGEENNQMKGRVAT